MLIVSPKGIIKDCSQGTESFYGYKKDEIVGHHVTDFMTVAALAQFKRNFKKISSVESVEGVQIVKKNKKVIEVWRKNFPFFNENGKLIEIFIYDRDVTEYVQVINKLEKLNKKMDVKMKEMKKMNDLMIGRELRMFELKRKIKDLKEKSEGKK